MHNSNINIPITPTEAQIVAIRLSHMTDSSSTLVNAVNLFPIDEQHAHEATSSTSSDLLLQVVPMHQTRDLILRLWITNGDLSDLFCSQIPLDGTVDQSSFAVSAEIQQIMGDLLLGLVATASTLEINLESVVLNTMGDANDTHERDWSLSHYPRSIYLSLAVKLGQLASKVQFKGDSEQTLAMADVDNLRRELVYCTIALLRLAVVCNVDLSVIREWTFHLFGSDQREDPQLIDQLQLQPKLVSSTSPNSVRFLFSDESHVEDDTMMAPLSWIVPMNHTRNLIFRLETTYGKLSSLFLAQVPLDGSTDLNLFTLSTEIQQVMGDLLFGLISTAFSLGIHLEKAIQNKMELNSRKYPVKECQGKADKYTAYSHLTGITERSGQSTIESTFNDDFLSPMAPPDFIERVPFLTKAIRDFAHERKWWPFHQPRNLILAFSGELGELAGEVQFRGDSKQRLGQDELDKLRQEVADCTIYLLRLADVCNVYLPNVREWKD